MKLNLYSIACKHFHEVERFCIKDLAGIFNRCLEHEEPRAEVDWLTAERWINKKLRVFDFTEKYLILSVYEELRKMDSGLSQINSDYSGKISSDELERTKTCIYSNIFLDRFENFVNSIALNKRKENMKRFLGRDVWDELYQPFRRMLQDTEVLNGSKYGKILFN